MRLKFITDAAKEVNAHILKKNTINLFTSNFS